MHKLSLWTASAVLACALPSCGESVDTTGTSSGAGGSGGNATTSGGTMNSGSSTAGSGGGMAGSGGMTGSGGSLAGSGGSMAGSGGSGGSACVPKTTDLSAKDTDCMTTMQCPAGYTCHPFNGFSIQWTCQILCSADCECPAGIQCVTASDKMNTWMQCGP